MIPGTGSVDRRVGRGGSGDWNVGGPAAETAEPGGGRGGGGGGQ